MRGRLTYVALGIVITLGASALVYQFGFGAGKLHASRPQASATQVAPSPVESPRPALLAAEWSGYKDRFIQPDGRVIDFQRDQVTTSEGQSYAMLRAVWMNDRPTFDMTWRWTQDNLGDPARSRIGWLWGKAPDGSWRLLDSNSASDADEDIALALLFAAHQWSSTYRPAAIALLGRIWDEDVATVAGLPYLAAGNWAPGAAGGPVLNPSYFAPYEYRIFAQEDHAHPWGELVDSSYKALQACTDSPLDSGAGRLPPNWCALDVATGAAHPAPGMSQGSDYGYDAFRVMWRVALDASWNLEPRAVRYLNSHSMVLLDSWRQQGKLASEYTHDGAVRNPNEDPTVYGGAIASFLVVDRNAADQMTSRLEATATSSGQDGMYFGTATNYFEQNWIWFGLAFAYGSLRNLDR
jgi:endo-1,4-beta-D-glucanase Y